MPEIEEVEYDIDPKDLRIDIYHASGAGGQNVNKVATAVRIVHLPTNIKVEMQEERTQQKNREKAMKIIRARVADHFAQIAQDEQDAERKSTIGTGDRSDPDLQLPSKPCDWSPDWLDPSKIGHHLIW